MKKTTRHSVLCLSNVMSFSSCMLRHFSPNLTSSTLRPTGAVLQRLEKLIRCSGRMRVCSEVIQSFMSSSSCWYSCLMAISLSLSTMGLQGVYFLFSLCNQCKKAASRTNLVSNELFFHLNEKWSLCAWQRGMEFKCVSRHMIWTRTRHNVTNANRMCKTGISASAWLILKGTVFLSRTGTVEPFQAAQGVHVLLSERTHETGPTTLFFFLQIEPKEAQELLSTRILHCRFPSRRSLGFVKVLWPHAILVCQIHCSVEDSRIHGDLFRSPGPCSHRQNTVLKGRMVPLWCPLRWVLRQGLLIACLNLVISSQKRCSVKH